MISLVTKCPKVPSNIVYSLYNLALTKTLETLETKFVFTIILMIISYTLELTDPLAYC